MLKSRTMVATPAYRGETVMQYTHSLVRDAVLATMRGHFVEAPHIVPDTIPCMARARMTQTFYNTGSDFLMMIDADMGWQADALGDMIDLPADMDIVCGIYRLRDDKPVYVVHGLPDVPLSYPFCEIEKASSGFMRVTRSCIERMYTAYPNRRLFSHITDEKDEEWGEDLSFCMRARKIGCRVYGKFDINFEHVGPKAWSGSAHQDLGLPETGREQLELQVAA